MLLGWGARYWQLESRLENSMEAVSNNLPDETLQIQGILEDLTDIDTKITDALGTVGVTGVSAIKLDSDQGISHLKAEGRRLVEAIAAILQVNIKKNYYGSSMAGGYIPQG